MKRSWRVESRLVGSRRFYEDGAFTLFGRTENAKSQIRFQERIRRDGRTYRLVNCDTDEVIHV